MVEVELRETGGGNLVFNFIPDPAISIKLGKFIDYDDIAFQISPQAYDQFSQALRITIIGFATQQTSGEAASGSNESLRKIFMLMRGWFSYNNDGTITPGTEKKYTLRIKHPDPDGFDGTDHTDFEVIAEGGTWDPAPLYWGFSIVFRVVDDVVIV